MNREEITELYSRQAGTLRAKGRYKDAERLVCCHVHAVIHLCRFSQIVVVHCIMMVILH